MLVRATGGLADARPSQTVLPGKQTLAPPLFGSKLNGYPKHKILAPLITNRLQITRKARKLFVNSNLKNVEMVKVWSLDEYTSTDSDANPSRNNSLRSEQFLSRFLRFSLLNSSIGVN